LQIFPLRESWLFAGVREKCSEKISEIPRHNKVSVCGVFYLFCIYLDWYWMLCTPLWVVVLLLTTLTSAVARGLLLRRLI